MDDILAIKGPYRATSCEWITGGTRFAREHCGKPVVEEKAYCQEHMDEAYYIPKNKKAKSNA